MKWIKWNAVDRNKKSDSSSKQYVCYYIPISIFWALSLSLSLSISLSPLAAYQVGSRSRASPKGIQQGKPLYRNKRNWMGRMSRIRREVMWHMSTAYLVHALCILCKYCTFCVSTVYISTVSDDIPLSDGYWPCPMPYSAIYMHWTYSYCIDMTWHDMTWPVLYCIVLYCIVLYCIVLYCIVLYCIVLYCIV